MELLPCHSDQLTNQLTNQLTDHPIDRLTDRLTNTPIRWLIHISDVHIKDRRRDEYREVFDRTVDSIEKWANRPDNHSIGRDQFLIVITGDLFHYKTHLHPVDIVDATYLLRKLAVLADVVLIPGNHDMNLNNNDHEDLISPLIAELKLPGIFYFKKSGRYIRKNICFYHLSLFDGNLLEVVRDSPCLTHVALIHEEINGARMNKILCKGYRMHISYLEQFDLVLAGHLHDHQMLGPAFPICIGYAGALIQQRMGETLEKGYLLWDVLYKSATFVRVPNRYGYIKLICKADKEPTEMSSIDQLTFIHAVSIEFDQCSIFFEDSFTQRIADLTKCVPHTVRLNTVVAHHEIAAVMETLPRQLSLIEEYLRGRMVDPSMIERICAFHGRMWNGQPGQTGLINQPSLTRWRIISMEWSNLYCYAANNRIDFSQLGGLIGLIAPNRSGKSSIIDILMLALFGRTLRGDAKSIINKKSNGVAHILLWLEVGHETNMVKYSIERHMTYGESPRVSFWRTELINSQNQMSNCTLESIDKTYREISKVVGTFDDFCSSIIIVQDRHLAWIDTSGTAKREYFYSIFGLERLDKIELEVKELIKKEKILIDEYSRAGKSELIKKAVIEKCAAVEQLNIEIALCKAEKHKILNLPLPDQSGLAKINLQIHQLYANIKNNELVPDEFWKKLGIDSLQSLTEAEEEYEKLSVQLCTEHNEKDRLRLGQLDSEQIIFDPNMLNDKQQLLENVIEKCRLSFNDQCAACMSNKKILDVRSKHWTLEEISKLRKEIESLIATREKFLVNNQQNCQIREELLARMSMYKRVLEIKAALPRLRAFFDNDLLRGQITQLKHQLNVAEQDMLGARLQDELNNIRKNEIKLKLKKIKERWSAEKHN